MYLLATSASPAPQSIPQGFAGHFDWPAISDEEKARRGWVKYEPPAFDPHYQRAVPNFDEGEHGVWRVTYAVEFVEDYEAVLAWLLGRLAAKRWEIETGGTALPDGTPIPTDERTRNVIMAAYVKAKADPAYAIPNWKFGAGQFGPLDAATIIEIGDAIEAHVQAAFGREAEITAALEAKRAVGTLIEMWDAEIENGWLEPA